MSALGIDIRGVDDVSPMLELADGPRSAAEAVMTQLLHAPGHLWWAPEIGHDLRQYLHRQVDTDALERAVVEQCLTDERVIAAEAHAELSGPITRQELSLRVELTLSTAETAEFTVTVSQAGDVLFTAVTTESA